MIYLTGDTHGDFTRLFTFHSLTPLLKLDDTLIILGDAGFNYFGDIRDDAVKKAVLGLPFSVLCIHGNHEMRPDSVAGYEEYDWNGGKVYRQEAYPNILFAKDGEVYYLEGHKAIALGGAYSVDKHYRLAYGYRWFEDEQPSEAIRNRVEERLGKEKWQVDVVLSHTCPAKYIPTEVFIEGIDQSTVDNSTEHWLDTIDNRLSYDAWYCGHYHTEKKVDRLQFMYRDIVTL